MATKDGVLVVGGVEDILCLSPFFHRGSDEERAANVRELEILLAGGKLPVKKGEWRVMH